mmetsp:Transcript_24633/g.67000  ORF Transcript_24633/g.67000 Transcript_24633/m.67000 type:complete len:206 (-) Transcript_24633:897-1514(-)
MHRVIHRSLIRVSALSLDEVYEPLELVIEVWDGLPIRPLCDPPEQSCAFVPPLLASRPCWSASEHAESLTAVLVQQLCEMPHAEHEARHQEPLAEDVPHRLRKAQVPVSQDGQGAGMSGFVPVMQPPGKVGTILVEHDGDTRDVRPEILSHAHEEANFIAVEGEAEGVVMLYVHPSCNPGPLKALLEDDEGSEEESPLLLVLFQP